MIPGSIINDLKSRLGREAVLTDRADLFVYGFDATATPRPAEIVVRPASGEDLAWACEALWRAGIPLTARGAGTGFSGGAVPAEGGAVVVCDRLKGMAFGEGGAVRVEAGVIADDLNRYLKRYGRMYPVDPASSEVSTLGGHIAENAGGPRAVKYGVTRDYVWRLDVISPARGREEFNASVGKPDWIGILVGSEGTLAVTETATLATIPLPAARAAAMVSFDGAERAGEAANALFGAGVVPSKVEYLDRRSIGCLNAYEPGSVDGEAAAVLLIEFDGDADAVAWELKTAREAMETTGYRRFASAADEAGADKLWRVRKNVSPALGRIAPHKMNEDVCVPRSRIPALLRTVGILEKTFGLQIPVFGHIGDGNLHVNIMYDKRREEEAGVAEKAVETLMAEVIALGGTLTGEHGVGLAKARFLPLEQAGDERRMATEIKAFFDPNNLLNPRKLWWITD